MKEVGEVKERNDRENGARVGAFFDLDGTLLAGPSLERRFFRMLRYRRAIGVRNYLLWLGEAARLAPRGILAILQANKMYLRGVRVVEGDGGIGGAANSDARGGPGGMGAARTCVPTFFSEAVERVGWHASQGHAIVIVSGTLELLARGAARALEGELAARGRTTEVHALGTRLEEAAGSWTGRIAGEAMFGEEKARAVRRLAAAWGLDLARSYAYGDSTYDRWMLAAVGRPAAVNAGEELRGIARLHGWPEMRWKAKRSDADGRSEVLHSAWGQRYEKRRGGAETEPALGMTETNSEKIRPMKLGSLG